MTATGGSDCGGGTGGLPAILIDTFLDYMSTYTAGFDTEDIEWKPQNLHTQGYEEEEEEWETKSPRAIFNLAVCAVFAIIIGIYAGIRSRDFYEMGTFTFMFIGETALAEVLSRALEFHQRFHAAAHKFAVLFASSAVICVIVHVLNRIFGNYFTGY